MRPAKRRYHSGWSGISIHASRMGCDFVCTVGGICLIISIHASRMGCDIMAVVCDDLSPYFNPRIPYGMRRRVLFQLPPLVDISIHASRMGCDRIWQTVSKPRPYFNPRIPYGMRPRFLRDWGNHSIFQSTHPVWDATTQRHEPCRHRGISIHASRMGCDTCPLRPCASSAHFNPRIPYGMRPARTPPSTPPTHFNPRIPYGMRPLPSSTYRTACAFQSTHPVWDATAGFV